MLDELKDRKHKWEKFVKSGSLTLAATEIINVIYLLLSRLSQDGGFTKDLAYLLDQLPPSVRAEVSAPLKKEFEIFQAVAFAPTEAWKELKEPQEFRRHAEICYGVLEKMIQLTEDPAN